MVPLVASLSGKKRQQHQLHVESSDGEHRQQPAPASNIRKCRRHPGENNDAVPNGQQSMPPHSLFFDQWDWIQIQEVACSKVRSILTPLTVQLALQRILPFPCIKQYTVVILMSQASRIKRLKSLMQSVPKSYSRDAKDSLMKFSYISSSSIMI
ncbi:hypothetical protein H5410_037116 [Solanum commersonii]|uniref:Uncharacterized protein n=1 Tax=Solanum commersonii TaxID=4109 RepID=A0A9J5Y9B5_SOLCO|nr:hypothetical protein H5410_037116 [Solanum commersonii]